MTAALLELDWLGGWSERRLRRRRPGIDELPWGTLQLAAIDPVDLAEARAVWTNGVFTEYASAAAFSQLTTAMLEAGAPVDLTAASADIVVDELHHVELVSRLVMELGGAVPYQVDLEKVTQLVDGDARAVLRAAELAVTTSGVGEALSVPALTRSRSLTTSRSGNNDAWAARASARSRSSCCARDWLSASFACTDANSRAWPAVVSRSGSKPSRSCCSAETCAPSLSACARVACSSSPTRACRAATSRSRSLTTSRSGSNAAWATRASERSRSNCCACD